MCSQFDLKCLELDIPHPHQGINICFYESHCCCSILFHHDGGFFGLFVCFIIDSLNNLLFSAKTLMSQIK